MSDKKLILHRVNNPEDLEIIYPTEVAGFPGFYYFPQDDRIAVSKYGAILNLKTGKLLKPVFAGAGRMQVLFTTPGVKASSYSVHRVIATTFIGRPSRHLDKAHSELEVNHIDGERKNNRLDNLEWVSSIENIKHAHISGFHPKDKPVLAKNIKSGTITVFNSSKACADKYGIHRATFWRHLKSANTGKYQKDMHVFKYDDGLDWPIIDISSIKTIGDREMRKASIVNDLNTGKVTIFENLSQAAEFIEIPITSLWRQIKRLGFFANCQYKVSLLD